MLYYQILKDLRNLRSGIGKNRYNPDTRTPFPFFHQIEFFVYKKNV